LQLIRSYFIVVLLSGTGTAAGVRAQEPTSTQEQPQEGTMGSGVDDVSLLNQDSQQAGRATDGKSSLGNAPTGDINLVNPVNPSHQDSKQPKRILWIIPNY
jgi:hypothetical protein